jgi:potassium uptake protein ktrA
MKSMLIIGMGRFGQHLCRNLSELGHQIMIIDKDEERLEEMLPFSEEAKVGDCTNIEVLKSLGVGNYDAVFVCIGTDFQSSLETTSLLKELGAKYVVSKATRDIQAKFLLRNGADEVIYPDRDIAMKTAIRYSSSHIFDFIEFTDNYSIYEISAPKSWIGKSIKDLDVRNKLGIHIIGIKKAGKDQILPRATDIIEKEAHLMVIAEEDTIQKIIEEMED